MQIKIVEDKEQVKIVREALKENQNHCPCKIEKNKDTLCPCKDFRERKSLGVCDCGLYNKTEV